MVQLSAEFWVLDKSGIPTSIFWTSTVFITFICTGNIKSPVFSSYCSPTLTTVMTWIQFQLEFPPQIRPSTKTNQNPQQQVLFLLPNLEQDYPLVIIISYTVIPETV